MAAVDASTQAPRMAAAAAVARWAEAALVDVDVVKSLATAAAVDTSTQTASEDESADDGDGGVECVESDGIGVCGAVVLTSVATATVMAPWMATAARVARWAEVVPVDVDVVQSS